MTVEEIRRLNINYWADKIGRGILAKKAGYSDTAYVNQLCGGHGSFGKRTARKLEKVLNLEVGEFDRINDYLSTKNTLDNLESHHVKTRKVPLISFVQAGEWGEANDPYSLGDGAEFEDVPLPHSDSAYCLEIRGESMWPVYQDGGKILVEPHLEPRHDDDVIVRTPDGNVTFKRLHDTPEGKYLVALNPEFPNRIVRVPEGTEYCGVVTGYWMKTRRR